MTLSALIIDDEQLARDELMYLLDSVGGVEVLAQGTNGIEAVNLIEEHRPDLVFLDVQMPGLDGFAVIKRLKELSEARLRQHPGTEEEPLPHIVFATAYDQYAVRAFDVNAVDYLLKPVDASRLEQALQRARKRLGNDRPPADPLTDRLERIVRLMADREVRREQVAVKVGERFMLVQADEIIFASLADESINIVTGQVTGTSNYRTLDDLQARLDPAVFWRVHRSHLVNINKIKEIVPWFSRNYILRMKDARSTEIPVSRAQTKRLREYLKL